MKKILLLLALLASSPLWAQNPAAIVERYYKATGLDVIDPAKGTVATDVEFSTNGITMEMSCIMKFPDKLKIDMTAQGMPITMIVNGDQGRMTLPGMPAQEIPKDKIQELRKQNNLFVPMKWSAEDHTFTLKAPVTKNGKTYDVVEMIPKNGKMPYKSQLLCFDRKTGLLEYSTTEMNTPQGVVKADGECSGYVSNGGFVYPAQIKMTVSGVVMNFRIKKMAVNQTVSDDLFKIAK